MLNEALFSKLKTKTFFRPGLLPFRRLQLFLRSVFCVEKEKRRERRERRKGEKERKERKERKEKRRNGEKGEKGEKEEKAKKKRVITIIKSKIKMLTLR